MFFVRRGSEWRSYMFRVEDVTDVLPTQVYTLDRDPAGFFLREAEPFVLPPKVYGDAERRAKLVLEEYGRKKYSSALMAGVPGSGKTMLAKLIAVRSGMPTIIINSGYSTPEFMNFMQSLTFPAVILFDEFEKVYSDENARNGILTMFDGAQALKDKIVLVTANSIYRLSEYFINRPSRLRYYFPYKGLEEKFIRDYCADKLDNHAEHVPAIVIMRLMNPDFNFDMLESLVGFLNLYPEYSVQDACEVLNVKPISISNGGQWEVKSIVQQDDPSSEWSGNFRDKSVDPMKKLSGSDEWERQIHINVTGPGGEEALLIVTSDHFVKIDETSGDVYFSGSFEVSEDSVVKGGNEDKWQEVPLNIVLSRKAKKNEYYWG